jgi:hypothetical protein
LPGRSQRASTTAHTPHRASKNAGGFPLRESIVNL